MIFSTTVLDVGENGLSLSTILLLRGVEKGYRQYHLFGVLPCWLSSYAITISSTCHLPFVPRGSINPFANEIIPVSTQEMSEPVILEILLILISFLTMFLVKI